MPNRLNNVLISLLIVIISFSCSENKEIAKLTDQNQSLAFKVDSLQNLLNKYQVLTVLNNDNFSLFIGETYSVESMAVLRQGLILDSLFINDRYISSSDSDIVSHGFFGPIVSFTPDSVGIYNIKAIVSSFAWNNRSINSKWTIVVKDK